MRRPILPIVCALLALGPYLAGCERVDVASLPPVPQVRYDTFLPGVQTQLRAAYEDVAARPASAAANGHLAMLLQTYKQFAAADVMYERVRLIEPDEFQWTYLHGVVQGAVGKPDAAIASFRRALTLTDAYPLAKLRLADLLAERGDVVEADALYDDVVKTAAPMSEVYFSHGRFLLREGRVDQAIAAFNEAIRLGGTLGSAYYQLGLAYRQKGERDKAQTNFALARKHEGYAAESADRYLNKLLPLNLSETPFVHRAKVLAENGRLDEAGRFIAMALERNPDSVAAHVSMMGLATARGDFPLVDKHFELARALDDGNAKLYFNLGLARVAEDRLVEAERAFNASLRRDDTDPNAHVQFAVLRHRGGNTTHAREHLEKALALDPMHQRANWLLGEMHLEADRPDEAAERLTRATREPMALRPIMFAKLAQARLRLGDVTGAAEAIDAARRDLTTASDPSMARFVDRVAAEVAAGTSGSAPSDST